MTHKRVWQLNSVGKYWITSHTVFFIERLLGPVNADKTFTITKVKETGNPFITKLLLTFLMVAEIEGTGSGP